MREGVAGPSTMVYGGFWWRFLAVLLDGIIVAVVSSPLYIMFGVVGFQNSGVASQLGLITVTTLIRLTLACAYYVYFWSQKGATPGKMVLGLKVVTANGGLISVGRAFGRYFAQILSGLILGIGYIMAAFDEQKRALHDHICGTRVIRVT
jgi:uncharacterized RDD family membrane protein YckC